MSDFPGFRRVELSDGRFTLIPNTMFILNPEKEGKTKYLYLFYTCPDEHHTSPDDAGDFYGWYSDFNNLHIFGQDNTYTVINRNDKPALRLYKQAQSEVVGVINRICTETVFDMPFEDSGKIIIAWMIYDFMGRKQRVGYYAVTFESLADKSNKGSATSTDGR